MNQPFQNMFHPTGRKKTEFQNLKRMILLQNAPLLLQTEFTQVLLSLSALMANDLICLSALAPLRHASQKLQQPLFRHSADIIKSMGHFKMTSNPLPFFFFQRLYTMISSACCTKCVSEMCFRDGWFLLNVPKVFLKMNFELPNHTKLELENNKVTKWWMLQILVVHNYVPLFRMPKQCIMSFYCIVEHNSILWIKSSCHTWNSNQCLYLSWRTLLLFYPCHMCGH